MKYKLTNETMIHNGITLHRIECTEAFANVKVGDKGGWVEKEYNLSQEGYAWIYNDAKVYDNALVYGDAKIYDNAKVCSNAQVYGNAEVCDNTIVWRNAKVYGNARVWGDSAVGDCAKVFDNGAVCGNAKVCDYAKVYGNACVCGNARVFDDAEICGDALVGYNVTVCGNANVESIEDYMVFKNCWSSGRYFTWTRSNNMWNVGCFYGTGKELLDKAYKDSTKKGDCYKTVVDCVENLIKIMNNNK